MNTSSTPRRCEKWNITKDTPQLPGGRITRDPDGELNGELVDRAKSLVQLPPPPPLTHRVALRSSSTRS